jgi:hypothetical protein
MLRRSVLLPFIFVMAFSASVQAKMKRDVGYWAANAQPVEQGYVWSPDHRIAAHWTENGIELRGKSTTPLQGGLAIPPLLEVLWSPDSRAIAVTGSDGGEVGDWHAYLYILDDQDGAQRRDIDGLLAPLIHDFPKCDEDDNYANLGAVAWAKGGKELLVLAQVPSHGTCHNMGARKGFRISIPDWTVIQVLSEAEVLQKWKHMLGYGVSYR